MLPSPIVKREQKQKRS